MLSNYACKCQFSLDILSNMRTSQSIIFDYPEGKPTAEHYDTFVHLEKRQHMICSLQATSRNGGKSLGKPWQFSELGLDHSLQMSIHRDRLMNDFENQNFARPDMFQSTGRNWFDLTCPFLFRSGSVLWRTHNCLFRLVAVQICV